MISLLTSETFQNEYKTFKEEISKITNESMRAELDGLLSKLVLEVKILDTYHTELMQGHSLPTAVGDSKGKIVEIRKRLTKRLADWKQSQS
jgi:hypothetical protein